MITEKETLEMAKLMFFNMDGGAPGEWDKLGAEKKELYIQNVSAIVENFSRLGLGVMPLNYTAPDTRKKLDRVILEMFIKDFIVARIKKPSGIVNIFPSDELAYAIAKEFCV